MLHRTWCLKGAPEMQTCQLLHRTFDEDRAIINGFRALVMLAFYSDIIYLYLLRLCRGCSLFVVNFTIHNFFIRMLLMMVYSF